MFSNFDPLQTILLLGFLSLIPLAVMVTTCFLKIVVVLMLTRNALGVQQIPPTMVLQAIALAMTIFVMSPTITKIYQNVQGEVSQKSLLDQNAPAGTQGVLPSIPSDPKSTILPKIATYIEPMREFMLRFANPDQRSYFLASAKRIWPKEIAQNASDKDYMILIPAFVVTELQKGFEIGFLIFLPFVVIDLVISNILMALGMQQVSPNTVSLPLKIFLFVMVDGWAKLLHSLVESYV